MVLYSETSQWLTAGRWVIISKKINSNQCLTNPSLVQIVGMHAVFKSLVQSIYNNLIQLAKVSILKHHVKW